MKTFIVMPAYNAERTLLKTYRAIPPEYAKHIIIVDDSSADKTCQIAGQIPNATLIRHRQNTGYGGSQKTGYLAALDAGADIIVLLHPDFQYDPSLVPAMTQPIKQDQKDFIMGSRFLKQNPLSQGMPLWRYAGNRLLTVLQNFLLGQRLSEYHSGYRAYSRQALQTISFTDFPDDFSFDSYMVAALAQAGCTFGEVSIPTRYAADSSSISFRSSVGYGFKTLWVACAAALNRRRLHQNKLR